ncbi:ATP-binding response regulator [Blautia sp. Sow4_E7]|uniref:ATP-binding response regulator n=1 Tax=Blautia sp. Sow4_E7 TaxID=3438749 RepID=UPI003F91A433
MEIFEPFERAPETESLQGTGLGMTITRNLIHLMNGMIEFTSEPGKGTCFHVIIPMKASEILEKPEQIEHIEDETPDWSQRRILVVEDNELNMEITCTFLEETGVSFETAVNGKEALDMFEASPQGYYDLILMDVQMPVMNGYEATRRIRSSSHPDAVRIPVIAMTANAFSEDIYAARQAGMNEHLSKPVEIAKMYHILRKWMSEENTREENL